MIADVDIYRTFVLTPAIRSQSGWEHKEGELSFLSPDPNESHYCDQICIVQELTCRIVPVSALTTLIRWLPGLM